MINYKNPLYGDSPEDLVKYWLDELEDSDKTEKDWRDDAKAVVDIYRGEDVAATAIGSDGQKMRKNTFNILWSNIETLKPAIYNKTPVPNVQRRFKDEDQLGKAVAQVLERSLEFMVDASDFDRPMSDAVDDYLLVGRGVTRVRYVPTFGTPENLESQDVYTTREEAEERATQIGCVGSHSHDENGKVIYMPCENHEDYEKLVGSPLEMPEGVSEDYEEPVGEVVKEEVVAESVAFEDFRRGTANKWTEVNWVGFQHKLTKQDIEEKFGEEMADSVGIDVYAKEEDDTYDNETNRSQREGRVRVWEIWCKATKKVYFIAPSFKDKPLNETDDPLGLSGFFPVPRPIYSLTTTDSLIPVSEYYLYKTLATELNNVTKRIIDILKGLRLRGIYDSRMSEIERLMDSGDNKMIPLDGASQYLDAGGLDKAIWMMPIDKYVGVVNQLYAYRQNLITSIYEITGISDVLRGSSVASETATAQSIKANYGSMRLQRRQREVQRYARDVIRLMAEVIAEQFSVDTLQKMTGLNFPTEEEKAMMQSQMQMQMQQFQMQAQQMQMQGQQPAPPPQPDPQMLERLEQPTWEQIQQVARDDLMREFKVDIETDSTVAANDAEQQQNITELLTGITSFLNGIGPAVESGAVPIETAKSLLMAAVRRFKLGTEVETAVDKIGDQPIQNPEQQAGESGEAEMAKQQAEMARLQSEQQAEMAKQKMELELAQSKHQMEMQKLEREAQIDQADHQMKMQEMQAKAQSKIVGL